MVTEPSGREPRARASILDVAERAGVSAATVSRSLRGLGKVSPQTRQRVLDAASDLSYVNPLRAWEPDAETRTTVAVIVPFIHRWFFSTVIAGAIDLLRAHGYDTILYHLDSAAQRDQFFGQMPLTRRVSGVLTVAMPLSDEHTLALRALGLPLVSVGSVLPGAPSVAIDDVAAARAATQHLINLKHERIGLITAEPDDPRFEFASSAGRRLGYQQALTDAGLELDDRLTVSARHGIDGGAEAMAELLTRPVLPTAVLAEYDELAFGALWALRRAGLQVPRDLSVMGIDDHEMSGLLDLTTVAQGARDQGRVGARLLLHELGENGTRATDPQVVATRLLLRGSTAPPHRHGDADTD